MNRVSRAALVLVLLVCVHARAETDPALEAAHGHHVMGTRHFEAGRYADALAEFQAAYRARALPALLYNIAQCQRRLGQIDEAIASLRAFRETIADPEDSNRYQQMIDEWQAARPAAAAVAVTAAPPPRPPDRLRPAAIGLAVLSGATLATGLALYGVARARYDELTDACGSRCAPQSWSGAERQAFAAYALIPIGATLAVADIALWVARARHLRRRAH